MKTVELKAKLEDNELETLRTLDAKFKQLKGILGELEIQKHEVMGEVRVLRTSFGEEEKKLVEKYGAESVINLQTGEITKKEENG